MKDVRVSELRFDSNTCLIPVVTQDWQTRDVLMLAYANEEALRKTIDTGYAHYWSRSRRSLWRKGETSGNSQIIKTILIDCDHDAVLYLVDQNGPACHTGEKSCFHNLLLREKLALK